MKATAIGLHGAEGNAPALVLADALDQRQTQPQALTALLTAAYERLEHRFTLVFGNADAGIGHLEDMLRPFSGIPPASRQIVEY